MVDQKQTGKCLLDMKITSRNEGRLLKSGKAARRSDFTRQVMSYIFDDILNKLRIVPTDHEKTPMKPYKCAMKNNNEASSNPVVMDNAMVAGL